MDTYTRIKDLADARGISIAELERRSDVGNGTIRRWGKTLPTADKLQRVARLLNTTIDYLVTGEKAEDEKIKVLARDLNGLTESQYDLIYNMIKEFKEKN